MVFSWCGLKLLNSCPQLITQGFIPLIRGHALLRNNHHVTSAAVLLGREDLHLFHFVIFLFFLLHSFFLFFSFLILISLCSALLINAILTQARLLVSYQLQTQLLSLCIHCVKLRTCLNILICGYTLLKMTTFSPQKLHIQLCNQIFNIQALHFQRP